MSSKRSLIIDGQLFQTNTWNRGMGKYSIELLKTLNQQGFLAGYKEVRLLLNKAHGLDDDRRQLLKEVAPGIKIDLVELQSKCPSDKQLDCLNENKRRVTRYTNKVCKDTAFSFLILSVFEWDEALPVFPNNCDHKMLISYDVIPLLFSDTYLTSDHARNVYLSRYSVLYEADQLFTISETTRNDLITFVGIPPERVINIDGAPAETTRQSAVSKQPETVGNYRYILLPTGNDMRKNNIRAAQAFKKLNDKYDRTYRLVITSSFDDETQKELLKISDDIVFSGNVSEDEIHWLFEHAEVVFFPTIYEGLGMPILEAIDAKKTIACSDIPVFNEMSRDKAFYRFDPYDVDSMVQQLEAALSGTYQQKLYDAVRKKYQWPRTGQLFTEAVKTYTPTKASGKKPKVAVMSPAPSTLSGIGKLVELLHCEMVQQFDVEYYFEGVSPIHDRTSPLIHSFKWRPIEDFEHTDYQQFDTVIYHIGNSNYHAQTVWLALRYPGTAVVHDTKLEGLYFEMLAEGLINQVRHDAEEKLTRLGKSSRASMATSLVAASEKVVVHSEYAKQALDEHNLQKTELAHIPLPTPQPVNRYSTTHARFTVGVGGIIHPTKGVDNLVELASTQQLQKVTFVVFGYSFAADPQTLNKLKRLENVQLITDLSEFELQEQLARLDVLLNYRTSYNGESSYTTLEAMRHGVASVVRDIGWYSELPDGAVKKVSSPEQLADSIIEIKRQSTRDEYYQQARLHVQQNHTLKGYVNQLTSEIASTQRSDQVDQARNILRSKNNVQAAAAAIQKIYNS